MTPLTDTLREAYYHAYAWTWHGPYPREYLTVYNDAYRRALLSTMEQVRAT